jgi:hypothetical protein
LRDSHFDHFLSNFVRAKTSIRSQHFDAARARVPVARKYQNLSAVFGKRRLKARASPSVLERSTSPPDSFDRQTVSPEYGRPTEASAMLRVLRLAAFCFLQDASVAAFLTSASSDGVVA